MHYSLIFFFKQEAMKRGGKINFSSIFRMAKPALFWQKDNLHCSLSFSYNDSVCLIKFSLHLRRAGLVRRKIVLKIRC